MIIEQRLANNPRLRGKRPKFYPCVESRPRKTAVSPAPYRFLFFYKRICSCKLKTLRGGTAVLSGCYPCLPSKAGACACRQAGAVSFGSLSLPDKESEQGNGIECESVVKVQLRDCTGLKSEGNDCIF